MSPPVPPPDPPEYGPSKPARGREDTGLGRATTDLRSSVDSLQASIEQVLAHFSRREETSDVRRADSTITRAVIEDFVKAETERRKHEDDRRKKDEATATRRKRLLTILGTIASIVTVIVLGIWEGYRQTRPERPTIETVAKTIEDRTTALEENEEQTKAHVQNVDQKLDKLFAAIQLLGMKVDASNAPRPEPVEAPRPVRSKRPR